MVWLAVLTGAALALLLVPFTITFHVKGTDTFALDTMARWGWIELPAGSTAKSKAGTRAERKRRPPSRPPSLARAASVLGSPDFVGSVVRLARRLLRTLSPRNVSLWLRVGLDDPAATAWLWCAGSVLGTSQLLPADAAVDIGPDFGGLGFRIDGQATVRLVPLFVLALLFGYLLTPPPWRALARLRAA